MSSLEFLGVVSLQSQYIDKEIGNENFDVSNEGMLGCAWANKVVLSFEDNPMLIFVVLTSFQVIAVGSPNIAESDLRTMTTEPKYAVRVSDLQSPAEAEKVSKIICNGK